MMNDTFGTDLRADIAPSGLKTRATLSLPPVICRLAIVLGLASLSGCTTWNLTDALNWSESTPKPKTPARMTDIWTDTVFHQPGQRGVRGFGGRVMFYGEDGHKPVAVDGTFTVLAFDDTESKGAPASPEAKSPEKKYIIPADHLPNHYSKSPLGHSYSFWLPWDEVGGPERRICLVARFEPRKGAPIVSHPSHHVLPGATASPGPASGGDPTADGATQDKAAGSVQTVSYDAPAVQRGRREELSTLTIDVPPSFARGEKASGASRAGDDDPPQNNAAAAHTGKDSRPPAASATVGPAGGSPEASAAGASRSTRSTPGRFRARRGLAAPLEPDPVRRQPLPATWQSRLPPTPRSGQSNETHAKPPADEATPAQSPPR